VKNRRTFVEHGAMAASWSNDMKHEVALDQRTAVAQAFQKKRARMIQDQGGEKKVTEAQRTLIDLAITSKFQYDELTIRMFALPQGPPRYKLGRERQRLNESLLRTLQMLGNRTSRPRRFTKRSTAPARAADQAIVHQS